MNKITLDTFFKEYPEIKYVKGEKILRPHEFSEHVYYAASGYLRVYKVLKSGQEITYNWFNPSLQKEIVFGLTPLMDEIHIDAFSDVKICRAPEKEFHIFLQQNPDIYKSVIHELIVLFSEAIRQVEWLSIPDANTRLKLMLHTFGTRQLTLKRERKEKEMITLKLTHQLLASFSGLTRETVTIQLKKLKEQGYISRIDGIIVIDNLEKLITDI